jgi:hypothetical protein
MRRTPDAFRLGFILCAVLVTFGGALGNGFVWDDFVFIAQNPVVQDLANLPVIFTSGDAVGTGGSNPYYRPLTTTSFALDYALWGQLPAGYHATNLALHLAVCALLFFLFRRLTSNADGAFAATLLFAVHPAHSEPVGFISARADLICGLFMLLAVIWYLQGPATQKRSWRLMSAAAFALALLSKIVAIVLPALIAVHLVLTPREKRRWALLLPYVAISIAFLGLHAFVVPMKGPEGTALGIRIASAGPVLMNYLRIAFWPSGAKVFHDVALETSPYSFAGLAAWSGLAALSTAVLLRARRSPAATLGFVWFVGALLPVCGIVILLYPAIMADRYLYIPLMGAALAIAGALERLAPRLASPSRRAAVACALALLAGASSVSTAVRLQAWHDSISLWTAAGQDAPFSLFVQRSLGAALAVEGTPEEMERGRQILTRAVSIRDDDAKAHLCLARIHLSLGNLADAEREAWRAIVLSPSNPMGLTYLGMVMGERRRFEKAEELFRKALSIDPRYAEAEVNLGRLLDAKAAFRMRSR